MPVVFNKQKIILLIRNGIGYPNLFLDEDFLLALLRLFLGRKSGVFIDVGVNIGQTLLKVKTVDPTRHYIGFEPNRICADYVLDLITLNQYTNCEIKNNALSDRREQVELALNEATDAAASIVANLRPGYFSERIAVDCISFDELGLTAPISIVKIDVEGAELDVLTGMQNAIERFHPLIICEVLDSYNPDVLEFTQDRADRLCTLLETLSYRIFQIHHDHIRIRSVELVDEIQIKLWSKDSYFSNDYVFCHVDSEKEITELLSQLAYGKGIR
ncbi:FkbM family methyltransferase [Spirosoma fluminis]